MFMGKILFLIVPAVVLVGLLFYLSWIPDPQMANVRFLPNGLSAWADSHWIARTGVALFPLGVLIGGWLGVIRSGLRDFLIAVVMLAAVVLGMEIGQMLIPGRVFDWSDIQVGMAGGSLGLVFALALTRGYLEIAAATIRIRLKKRHIVRYKRTR